MTRLDRTEPTLNESLPGDERDTTSPRTMAGTMQKVLLGDVLSDASPSAPRLARQRQGRRQAAAGWAAGLRGASATRPAAGERGSTNAIAILWPPDRAPLIATVYYTESSAPIDARNAIHREIGGLIGETF